MPAQGTGSQVVEPSAWATHMVPVGQTMRAHGSGPFGTQAQTVGSESKCWSREQGWFAAH